MRMSKIAISALICLVVSAFGYPNYLKHTRTLSRNSFPFPFVTRAAWGANQPKDITRLNTPVQYVVIHHTYIPGICLTREQCMRDMRAMQSVHQSTNLWWDIGYNFAVGGEGSVYEGRGWEAVGAHAAGTNSQSIGIAIIGDYVSQLPPAVALQTTKQLISVGVQLGYIRPDYRLVGHRQVSATECPGSVLYQEIQTWDNFWGSQTEPDTINTFPFVTRAAWGANPPRSVTRLNTPVQNVVIHHTAVPGVCLTRDQCMRDMRSVQNTHQNVNGWADIGYNFAVGGEGSVYEGRGWQAVGAHAAGFNSQSIGIVIIGNFVSQLPPAVALRTARQLIASGVQQGFIRADYRLYGHRQVGSTECPGAALFREIQTWERFSTVV